MVSMTLTTTAITLAQLFPVPTSIHSTTAALSMKMKKRLAKKTLSL